MSGVVSMGGMSGMTFVGIVIDMSHVLGLIGVISVCLMMAVTAVRHMFSMIGMLWLRLSVCGMVSVILMSRTMM
ncbi:MAG: hypothetical protein BroJett018_51870 [Chloroflexota bacterium]|nr:MAG: hypothetical protein BroJett018_51870 [Chloroflexota bacterium]